MNNNPFKTHEDELRELMRTVGYGRTMQMAQEDWRRLLKEDGVAGGEFAVGPCVSMTVPCGCNGACDWCGGSGWLTKKVKEAKAKTKRSR